MKKQKKQRYRIRNRQEYNAALKARGSLTVWVDESAQAGWCERGRSGRRGASLLYSNSAIMCALTLQAVYHLLLRATMGLLASLLDLRGVSLPVPDYSTLSRRRSSLPVELLVSLPAGPMHLLVDASGFKVFGEGEWKVCQGQNGRKQWKVETNYHRRGLIEATFFQLKTIFGNTLSARGFEVQANELLLICAALNRMTQLGMPHSYPL